MALLSLSLFHAPHLEYQATFCPSCVSCGELCSLLAIFSSLYYRFSKANRWYESNWQSVMKEEEQENKSATFKAWQPNVKSKNLWEANKDHPWKTSSVRRIFSLSYVTCYWIGSLPLYSNHCCCFSQRYESELPEGFSFGHGDNEE